MRFLCLICYREKYLQTTKLSRSDDMHFASVINRMSNG